MNEPMMSSGRGYLRVSVRAAREALPIPDALVLVTGSDRENDDTDAIYSLRTDEDGLTEVVELSAPSASLSMTPGNPKPYGVYNITVQKDGYGSVENVGVPIFDGIVSTQPVALVPLSEFETDPEGERRTFGTPTAENPLL